MLVGVDPAHRSAGVPEELLRATAARFPDGLTHGYPISEAGQRFVTRNMIPVHPVDASKGFELWPDGDAERKAREVLETIRGRGSTPFPSAATTSTAVPDGGSD